MHARLPAGQDTLLKVAAAAAGCRNIRFGLNAQPRCLLLRHGPKRYLDPPDIVLDITRLLGTCSQKKNLSLCKAPIIMDDIQDLQNGQISIWTMPTAA
jgi:hypothetical protein